MNYLYSHFSQSLYNNQKNSKHSVIILFTFTCLFWLVQVSFYRLLQFLLVMLEFVAWHLSLVLVVFIMVMRKCCLFFGLWLNRLVWLFMLVEWCPFVLVIMLFGLAWCLLPWRRLSFLLVFQLLWWQLVWLFVSIYLIIFKSLLFIILFFLF